METMHPADIFAEQLAQYRHGRAMRRPEPIAAGSDLKEREIRIGDVGYFDEDHPFHRLFNIMVDEDHPHNSGGVPVGFTLVQFPIHLLSVSPDFLDPNPLCSKSVNIKSRGVDVLA